MPVITLLSDLGLHDASAGTVKGILLSEVPSATIVDISHEVTPFGLRQAAYLLSASYRDFPQGSIHVVIVDVFYASEGKLILYSYDGHFFLVPDNGILQAALGANPEAAWLCFTTEKGSTFRNWIHAAGKIAKAILADGQLSPNLPVYNATPFVARPINFAACEVLYIDNFGNVVTEVTRTEFDKQNSRGRFVLSFMKVNELSALSSSYSDVGPGESLCRFNRHGHLEICVNQGSAANLFGLRMGSRHNEIKITFE